MANLAEKLTALLKQAGIDETSSFVVDMQKKLATSEIPDEDVTKIENLKGNLTLESAKSNPDLIKHFRAVNLNGVDTELNNVMTDLGVSEEIKTAVLAETNTYKRPGILAKAIRDFEKAQVGASTGDKATLQKEIDKLNATILGTPALIENAKKEVKSEYDAKFHNLYTESYLSKKNLVDYAKDESFLLAKTKLMKEAESKGFKIVFENDKPRLINSEGMPAFENNVKVEFESFADSVLANNKLIVTANPAPNLAPNPLNNNPTPNSQGQIQTGASAMAAQESLKTFATQ